VRDPSHNSVDFAQRTAAPDPGDDAAELAAQALEKMDPYNRTWHDPILRKRWLDLYRDSQAGVSTTKEEDARLRQDEPEEEAALNRKFDDEFWKDPEGWRKAQPPRKL